MKICPKCGVEHDKQGLYCSRKCANSRTWSEEDKLKKSISAKNSEKIRTKIKEKKCKYCGSEKGKCKRPDICKRHSVFPTLIKYFGFNKEVVGTEQLYEEFEKIKSLLEEEYWENELSTTEIGEKYKFSNPYVFCLVLKVLNIKRRTNSESQQIKYKNGTHGFFSSFSRNQYQSGWHTTWNNKQVFLRSSYEFDYAKQLDKTEVDYEVEKLRIVYWDSQLYKQRVAIPDFYLTQTNTIVEIKSNYTYDEQNMKDKFKVYKDHGYVCKLILEKKEIDLIV